jgi:hypothetical protein
MGAERQLTRGTAGLGEAAEGGPHPLTPFAFGDEFVPGNGKNRPWPVASARCLTRLCRNIRAELLS